MEKHLHRTRKSYNNLDSYDDELAIVLELLRRAKDVEQELLKEFEEIFKDLVDLYQEWFPFYYPHGVLNKQEFQKLVLSFINSNSFETGIEKAIEECSAKVRQLETNRLMAWLILDYELTAKKTRESIGIPAKQILDEQFIKEKVLQPWCDDGKTFLQRIDVSIVDMEDKLHYVIAEGLYKGWTIEQMTNKLRTITGMAAYKAARLIRTETMAIYSKATKETFLANGIEYVEIIGDAACGGICLDYVGEAIPLREAQIGDDLPPYHPNCACSFCAYTEFEDE